MLMVMMLLIHTIHTIMLPIYLEISSMSKVLWMMMVMTIYLEISSMSKLLLTIPSNSAPLKNQR